MTNWINHKIKQTPEALANRTAKASGVFVVLHHFTTFVVFFSS